MLAEDLVENLHSLKGQRRLRDNPTDARRALEDIFNRQKALVAKIQTTAGISLPFSSSTVPCPTPNVLVLSMVSVYNLTYSDCNLNHILVFRGST